MSATDRHDVLGGVRQRLHALRTAIRRALLLAGLSRVALTGVALVLASLGADRLMRFDRAQRTILLVLGLATCAAVAWRRLWSRMRSELNDGHLCRAVERVCPGLRQLLLSAVELDGRSDLATLGYSATLARAAVLEGAEAAEGLDFHQALDRRAELRHLVIVLAVAGVLTASYLAFPATMSLWFHRNVLLRNTPWPQATYLVIPGLSDGRLAVAEGGRLDVMIEARGKVPTLVAVDVREGRRTVSEQLVRTGERHFRWTVARVVESFAFRVRGGDATTEWLRLDVVPRPKLAGLELEYHPPAYTQEPARRLSTRESIVDVLAGGRLELRGASTKPLLKVACIPARQDPVPGRLAGETAFALTLSPDKLTSGVYALMLTDRDELESRPAPRFTMRVLSDRRPEVKLASEGIGEMITPTARIPLKATFRDDYSVTGADLVVQPTGEGEEATRQAFPGFTACRGGEPVTHRYVLQVTPMDLRIDDHLVLHVEARDNDTYTGPKEGKSNTISLRVVSPEVLRYELLRREENQRRLFEALIKRQEDLLDASRLLASELADVNATWHARLRGAEKRQRLMAGELEKVARRYRQILDEMLNNGLEESDGLLQRRLVAGVVGALRRSAGETVPRAAGGLDRAASTALAEEERRGCLANAADAQEQLLREMREVLRNMRRFEGYQEAVRLLRSVLKLQDDVNEATIRAQEELIRRLLGGEE